MFNADGCVLIGRRFRDDGPEIILAGLEWQMPQGGVDGAEDLRTAAQRELWEETGVTSAIYLGEKMDLVRTKPIAAMREWCYRGFEPPAKLLEILAQVHRKRGGLGRSIFDHPLSRDVGVAGGQHSIDRRSRKTAETLSFLDRDSYRVIRRRLAAEDVKKAFGDDQSAGAHDN